MARRRYRRRRQLRTVKIDVRRCCSHHNQPRDLIQRYRLSLDAFGFCDDLLKQPHCRAHRAWRTPLGHFPAGYVCRPNTARTSDDGCLVRRARDRMGLRVGHVRPGLPEVSRPEVHNPRKLKCIGPPTSRRTARKSQSCGGVSSAAAARRGAGRLRRSAMNWSNSALSLAKRSRSRKSRNSRCSSSSRRSVSVRYSSNA